MKEKIEIEGERVKLMRLTAKGSWETEVELELKHFLDFIGSEITPPWEANPLLPPECRWYGYKKKNEVLIQEEPPMVRRIRFAARTKKRGDEAPEEFYELAFPYVVFAFSFIDGRFEEMKVFYRSAPLASMKDELYLCNLYNVQLSRGHRAHNRACLRPKPHVSDMPVHEAVQLLTNHFWNTEFNLDIEDSGFQFYAKRDSRLASLSAWEKAVEADPFFVLQFPWEPAGMRLLDVISFLMDQRRGAERPLSVRGLADMCYALADSRVKHPVFDHIEGVWRQ